MSIAQGWMGCSCHVPADICPTNFQILPLPLQAIYSHASHLSIRKLFLMSHLNRKSVLKMTSTAKSFKIFPNNKCGFHFISLLVAAHLGKRQITF